MTSDDPQLSRSGQIPCTRKNGASRFLLIHLLVSFAIMLFVCLHAHYNNMNQFQISDKNLFLFDQINENKGCK